MTDQSSDPRVVQLRERISEADHAILDALNRRVALVQELHDYKTERGYDLFDPQREERIVAQMRAANQGPLAEAEVDELTRFLLELTRTATRRLRGA